MRTCVLLHVSSVQPRVGKGCCRRHFWLFQEIPHFTSTGKIHSHSHLQWRIQGGGPAPLILNPNWGPKGRKKFFGDRPPPSLRVWMTGPPSPLISGSGWPGPPPPLSQGLDPSLILSQARRWPFLFMKDFLFFLFLYFFLNKIIDKIGVKVRSI